MFVCLNLQARQGVIRLMRDIMSFISGVGLITNTLNSFLGAAHLLSAHLFSFRTYPNRDGPSHKVNTQILRKGALEFILFFYFDNFTMEALPPTEHSE